MDPVYPEFSEISVRWRPPQNGCDAGTWIIAAPLVVTASAGFTEYEIPAGFPTDFATIPRFLWPIYPPTGKWAPAAVLHDWLYSRSGFPRHVADAWFLAGMRALGVPWWRRWLLYAAVRCFGWLWRRVADG